ncbi:MAG: hypothetical protein WBM62_21185 [Crocosphaera sp.]
MPSILKDFIVSRKNTIGKAIAEVVVKIMDKTNPSFLTNTFTKDPVKVTTNIKNKVKIDKIRKAKLKGKTTSKSKDILNILNIPIGLYKASNKDTDRLNIR